MNEWTEEDVIRICKRNGLPLPKGIRDRSIPDMPQHKKLSKYRNVKTEVDGEMIDSKREADRWKEWKLLLAAGEVLAVARQVDFYLPGGVKYRADFVPLYRDYHYEVEDAKGVRTPQYQNKKKQMKACLGIDIIEV